MNDFEDRLRDRLHSAVPDGPDEPVRAGAARAYAARRRRRTRTSLGVAAVVVAVGGVSVLPSVLGGDDGGSAPVATSPSATGATAIAGEPYACPPKPPKHRTSDAPGDQVPEGALLARLCVAGVGTTWQPPADALTSDVDALVRVVNDQEVLPDSQPCTMELGPAYTLTFQYADGSTVTVQGELFGCRALTVGDATYRGADQVHDRFLGFLHQQRRAEPDR
jgi:hypothetical protein